MRDGAAAKRRAFIPVRVAFRTKVALGVMGFLVALFCLAGCAEKDKIPSGILPRDKMQKILWDMIQADQYADLYLARDTAGSHAKLETLRLYQQVFELNQVSHEDFEKSFKFYITRPDLSRGLFDSISVQANKDRATIPAVNTPIVSPNPATSVAPKGGIPVAPFHPFARPGGRLLPPGRLPTVPPTSTNPPSAHPADSAARRANRPFHRHKSHLKIS